MRREGIPIRPWHTLGSSGCKVCLNLCSLVFSTLHDDGKTLISYERNALGPPQQTWYQHNNDIELLIHRTSPCQFPIS